MSSDATTDLQQPSALSCCQLNDWAIITVSGSDRIQYLNSQLTYDLSVLSTGQACISGHCDSQGKLWAVLLVFILDNKVLLAQKKSTLTQQLAALKKYAIFAQVTINKTSKYQLYGITGKNAENWLTRQYNQVITKNHSYLIDNGIIYGLSSRSSRYLLIQNKPITNINMQPTMFWQSLDIAAGFPWLEAQTQQTFTPHMLNLQAINAISFTKGCYMGQEVIARSHYRGVNKRAAYYLKGKAKQLPKPGDKLERQLGACWRNAGIILQAVNNQEQIELLAVLAITATSQDKFRLTNNQDSIFAIQVAPSS